MYQEKTVKYTVGIFNLFTTKYYIELFSVAFRKTKRRFKFSPNSR